MVDYESLQQAEKTILLRTIIRKTAAYFFYQGVVLKMTKCENILKE